MVGEVDEDYLRPSQSSQENHSFNNLSSHLIQKMNSNYPDFSMYPSSNVSDVDQWQFQHLNTLGVLVRTSSSHSPPRNSPSDIRLDKCPFSLSVGRSSSSRRTTRNSLLDIRLDKCPFSLYINRPCPSWGGICLNSSWTRRLRRFVNMFLLHWTHDLHFTLQLQLDAQSTHQSLELTRSLCRNRASIIESMRKTEKCFFCDWGDRSAEHTRKCQTRSMKAPLEVVLRSFARGCPREIYEKCVRLLNDELYSMRDVRRLNQLALRVSLRH